MKLINKIAILFLLSNFSVIGETVDGFDYPIGNRGYQSGNKVAIHERISPETNDVYVNQVGYTADNNRTGTGATNTWYNASDVGNYVDWSGLSGLHPGEDWNLPGNSDAGEPVYSVANGEVLRISSTFNSSVQAGGWTLIIQHTMPNQSYVYSVYSHLTCEDNPAGTFDDCLRESNFDLSEGDKVTKGQVIGRLASGSAMSSIGYAHLHLEMRNTFNGKLYNLHNGHGYYTDTRGETRPNGMSRTQVRQAFQLMHQEGILDPSDFIDQHRTISGESSTDTEWTTGHYSNDQDIHRILSIEGAEALDVTIQGETERRYDFVYIYNKDGEFIQSFDGEIDEQLTVSGDTIIARLVTDYSVTKSGVTISITTSEGSEDTDNSTSEHPLILGFYNLYPDYFGEESGSNYILYEHYTAQDFVNGKKIAVRNSDGYLYFHDGRRWYAFGYL